MPMMNFKRHGLKRPIELALVMFLDYYKRMNIQKIASEMHHDLSADYVINRSRTQSIILINLRFF
jgi:hypothetical protein